jgi:putative RNA 2'-phosphotransferase
MSEDGWVLVDELVYKLNTKSRPVNFDTINNIVQNDVKNRFDMQEFDGSYYIRANQGHTIKSVKIDFEEMVPPDILYHGTAQKSVDSILATGINKQKRQYVHLSKDVSTAITVGVRHGHVRVFEINAKQMHDDGIKFYLSKNGVWLTDYVDTKYIKLLSIGAITIDK